MMSHCIFSDRTQLHTLSSNCSSCLILHAGKCLMGFVLCASTESLERPVFDCLFQKRNCYRPFTLDHVQSISYQLCQAIKCKYIIRFYSAKGRVMVLVFVFLSVCCEQALIHFSQNLVGLWSRTNLLNVGIDPSESGRMASDFCCSL